jgi:hypothetical protein
MGRQDKKSEISLAIAFERRIAISVCKPVILSGGVAGVEESAFSLRAPKYTLGRKRKADPSALLGFAQDDGLCSE